MISEYEEESLGKPGIFPVVCLCQHCFKSVIGLWSVCHWFIIQVTIK